MAGGKTRGSQEAGGAESTSQPAPKRGRQVAKHDVQCGDLPEGFESFRQIVKAWPKDMEHIFAADESIMPQVLNCSNECDHHGAIAMQYQHANAFAVQSQPTLSLQ